MLHAAGLPAVGRAAGISERSRLGEDSVEAAARRDRAVSSEKRVLAESLVALSALPDALVWRNNTGQAWQGRKVEGRPGTFVRLEHGMVILREARPVKFGLEGSGDIVGAIQRRPVAVETKTLVGRQRPAQIMFERAWVKAGGIYVLARSSDEAVDRVGSALLIG